MHLVIFMTQWTWKYALKMKKPTKLNNKINLLDIKQLLLTGISILILLKNYKLLYFIIIILL